MHAVGHIGTRTWFSCFDKDEKRIVCFGSRTSLMQWFKSEETCVIFLICTYCIIPYSESERESLTSRARIPRDIDEYQFWSLSLAFRWNFWIWSNTSLQWYCPAAAFFSKVLWKVWLLSCDRFKLWARDRKSLTRMDLCLSAQRLCLL